MYIMLLAQIFLVFLTVNQVMSQTKRGNKASSRTSIQGRDVPLPGTEGQSVSAPGMPSVNVSLLEQTLRPTRSPILDLLPEQKTSDDMRLYLLKNTQVTCNDGTTAGYYIRESKTSKRWIIFLEGGWCCYSKETCDVRYKNVKRLMSSSDWPKTRRGAGILSPRQDENPHWWNLNAVFVPYCSSDVWSGNLSKSKNGEHKIYSSAREIPSRVLCNITAFSRGDYRNFVIVVTFWLSPGALSCHDYAFMGSAIIQEVVRELVPKGIKQAKSVIVAGSSAGGTGVLMNLDRVASLVEEMTADTVQVRGLVDSGWFIDTKHGKSDCMDGASCVLTDAIKRGLKLWNGALPEKCRQQYKKEDEWQCFYGPKSYTSMKTPIFIVQWLYDEEQLRIENIQPDFQFMTANQWNNIQSIGRELKKSLREVPAVFAPACFSHTLITASNWLDFQVKGVTLSRAVQCWMKSLQDRKGPKTTARGCSFHLIDNCQWPHCNPTCPALHDPVTGQEVTLLQMFLRRSIENQRRGQEPKGDMNQLMAMLRNGG